MNLLNLSPVLLLCATTSLSAEVLSTSFENLPLDSSFGVAGEAASDGIAFTTSYGGISQPFFGLDEYPAGQLLRVYPGRAGGGTAWLNITSVSEDTPASAITLGFTTSVEYLSIRPKDDSLSALTILASDFPTEGGAITQEGIEIILSPTTNQETEGWQWQINGTIDYFRVVIAADGSLDDVTMNIIPEPAAVSLMLLGLATLCRR
ncbi:hypothetical protein [Mucisphaera calidilacus]|uniref:PEP-CTERM protein-sorting domain-containing protein n=1 Tax=Mucisphaera calidilacus TaxID=2527982 RepID=A0A518BXA6_9BACT|nr:hypothetical protein [Mucisphaera calidilacus]QDU71588.1 hypothetical protein Pan265_14400 [Mucisphaera calidilacus]